MVIAYETANALYRFDAPPRAEVHRVVKRGRPYVTDHCRVGVRVAQELWPAGGRPGRQAQLAAGRSGSNRLAAPGYSHKQ